MQKITIEREPQKVSAPGYNERQYTEHADEYIAGNPSGLRGGLTPTERVMQFEQILPPGRIVLEIGPGPGHDARELVKAGYVYFGGDVAQPFVTRLKKMGLHAFRFDAQADKIPKGADGIFAHISLHHIPPRKLAMLLTSAREGLEGEKAIFLSVVKGFGHERSNRTGSFSREWFYYTPKRLVQILEQEGVGLKYFYEVEAFNGTPTIHAGGNFKQEYKSGSYGELELHPYGDIYYSLEALYPDNLINGLVGAQARAGLLNPDTRDFIKAANAAFNRGLINGVELTSDLNEAWAKGIAGRNISELTNHAAEFIQENIDHFNPLLAETLEINNNNGFSNYVVGCAPIWLLWAIERHFNINGFKTADWVTDPKGKITGEVSYLIKAEYAKNQVARHQGYLKNWLGPKYPRVTVGIGTSVKDAGFMSITDYPIFTSASRETADFAHRRGYYRDRHKQILYAGLIPWDRWPVCGDPSILADYLYMVTSNQHPIQPDPQYKQSVKRWQTTAACSDNFYWVKPRSSSA